MSLFQLRNHPSVTSPSNSISCTAPLHGPHPSMSAEPGRCITRDAPYKGYAPQPNQMQISPEHTTAGAGPDYPDRVITSAAAGTTTLAEGRVLIASPTVRRRFTSSVPCLGTTPTHAARLRSPGISRHAARRVTHPHISSGSCRGSEPSLKSPLRFPELLAPI